MWYYFSSIQILFFLQILIIWILCYILKISETLRFSCFRNFKHSVRFKRKFDVFFSLINFPFASSFVIRNRYNMIALFQIVIFYCIFSDYWNFCLMYRNVRNVSYLLISLGVLWKIYTDTFNFRNEQIYASEGGWAPGYRAYACRSQGGPRRAGVKKFGSTFDFTFSFKTTAPIDLLSHDSLDFCIFLKFTQV